MDIQVLPQTSPRGRSALQSFWVAALSMILFFPLFATASQGDDTGWILFFALGVGLVLGGLFFAFLRANSTGVAGVLSLEAEHVRWQPVPILPKPASPIELPYGELWIADLQGRGENEILVMKASPTLMFQMGTRAFSDPGLARPFLEDLLKRVESLPGGPLLREKIERRRALAARLQTGRSFATYGIALVLILVFLAELAIGAFGDTDRLLALGANSPTLVARGEIYRLATANLLHANLVHLIANLLGLISLGLLLEPLLGRARFLTLFLGSSLAGAAASALVGLPNISVGASTGLFGLAAASFFVTWRWADQLLHPPGGGQPWWLNLVLLFGAPVLLFGSRIDHIAHVGGFLAGWLLLLLMTRKSDLLLDLPRRNSWPLRIAAGLLIAIFVAAGVQVALSAPLN